MTVDELISILRSSNGPDPRLDRVLAQVLAWKQTVVKFHDEGSAEEERVRWLAPKSAGDDQIPSYTGSIQQAYIFARQIAPRSAGGFSWEIGTASAVVGSDLVSQVATPAIALLVASLTNLRGRLQNGNPER